ncbi:adenylate/guanylate cyclase domain-containing protein [Myxosarcina sp. GI1]|uniref:adenylate/guanylate cyclase domain-containing protein n=1 Tax=Myxosarcina sp. GI1 TaxID=1541065 RepID=UPI000B234044|nr:adenylate/guanylate cyclase domain-containing protein [Myxosarcina sp. GI1]
MSKILHRLVSVLLKRIIIVLIVLMCTGGILVLIAVKNLSLELVELQASKNAEWCLKALKEVVDVYSDDVVDRVKHKVPVSENYPTIEGAIPIPPTYSIVIGERISEQKGNFRFRVYSDYPFPSRVEDGTGGVQDKFEQDALTYLRNNPGDSFYRMENYNNRLSMRYGMPILMKASCISCHNTHPQSPKTDWRIGDVRGVMELTQPLDKFMEQNQDHINELSLKLGGLSMLSLLGIGLVIGRLRQATKELEWKVKSRTAQLTEANANLEERNGLIRQVFGRYLSNDIVTILIKDAAEKKLKLGGERRKITILTSDLRGFAAIAEQFSPEEVIKILNIYLEYMADVISEYQGTIDEFMGDGILVLFGAPVAKENDAIRAVACACAMQLKMGAVNERMKQMGLPTIEMGIGINTGDAVVGNIGSEKRTKYGIVGSQVNLAYRIESYTTGGQILISESTFKEVKSIVKIAGQKLVTVKGIEQPIWIYDVWGMDGFYNLFLPKEQEQFFPLAVEIPIQYRILEEKDVAQTIFKGSLIKLSAKGAKVKINSVENNGKPKPNTNIKLNFITPTSPKPVSDYAYAKASEKLTNKNYFYITFTSKSPEIEARLNKIYQWISR